MYIFLGIVCFLILFLGAFLGFMACRYFVKRGAGIMAVCADCKYKNACADFVPENLGKDEL